MILVRGMLELIMKEQKGVNMSKKVIAIGGWKREVGKREQVKLLEEGVLEYKTGDVFINSREIPMITKKMKITAVREEAGNKFGYKLEEWSLQDFDDAPGTWIFEGYEWFSEDKIEKYLDMMNALLVDDTKGAK